MNQLEEVKFTKDANWAEWRKRGKNAHSKYADPLFVAPEQGNFTLKPGLSALMLGFQPIDISQTGPRLKPGPIVFPWSKSKNDEGSCGVGFWSWARRRGRSIPSCSGVSAECRH